MFLRALRVLARTISPYDENNDENDNNESDDNMHNDSNNECVLVGQNSEVSSNTMIINNRQIVLWQSDEAYFALSAE